MAKLIAPSGTVVTASDELAVRLLERGYSEAEKPKPRAEAKRPAKSDK